MHIQITININLEIVVYKFKNKFYDKHYDYLRGLSGLINSFIYTF